MSKIITLIMVALLIAAGVYYLAIYRPNNPAQTAVSSMSPTPSTQTSTPNGEIVKATIKTSKGNIVLDLYPSVAPKTVANFVKLSKEHFYDGTKFHRVISEFMIQGGDPLSKTDDPQAGRGGPGYVFEDEINPKALGLSDDQIKTLESQGYDYNFKLLSLKVDVGVIAMANAGPNTNGSQFFIVTQKAQPHLDGRHTVFGRVVEGIEVVRSISQGDTVSTIEITK